MLTPAAPKPFHWQKDKYSPFKRQLEIFSVAFRFLFFLWWDRVWHRRSSNYRNRRARWLVRKLLDLGPTFIKIGQALSTRSDLLPPEYIQALAELQDRVPPFASADAIALIELELGKSVYALYRDFEPTPFASASLGQVHKARLHTGEDVVVKVQRPGLEQVFNLDFEVLHRLIRFANRFIPLVRKYNLDGIYYEFVELLYLEIDYIHEGKNAERFRDNFLAQPRIIAPIVYWQYTTKKILTLEYLPGIKVDDRQTLEASGLDPREIIQLGITSFLKQLLLDGFFQTDPHPGNMAVSQQGHLIFYDFGTMSEVKPMAKDQMVKTFFAVLRKDTDEVVTSLTYMGLIEPIPDMTPVRRVVEFLLERFTERPVDIRELEQVKDEIRVMFKEQPFRLPAQMTFILKAISTLDGIARALDPQYNLLAASKPFVASLTVSGEGKGTIVKELVRQGRTFIQYKFKQPNRSKLRIQQLEARLKQKELELQMQSSESDRALQRIGISLQCLIYACVTSFTFLSATVLFLANLFLGAIITFTLSGICLIFLLRSLAELRVTE